MANDVRELPPPNDSKQFLALLKQVLENFKSYEDSGTKREALLSLVTVYFNCPAKISAKRVLASFFQNLQVDLKSVVERNIGEELAQRMCIDLTLDDSVTVTRHCVDNIAALMENFRLGEHCLSSITLKVVRFLVEAERHFLSQVHGDVPPVHLNEVMHHCHVTVQTLNLLLQKTVVDSADVTKQIVADSNLLTSIVDLDLEILKNELFLLDCRCCCAMNIIVLLQLSVVDEEPAQQVPSIIFPEASGENGNVCIQWLTLTQAESLDMKTMSNLSYLAMAFGYIAAVYPQEIVREKKGDWFFYLDSLIPHLLSHGKKCTDTMSKALFSKTVHMWTLKLLNTLQEAPCPSTFSERLCGHSSVLYSLLEYIWTHWDDQLDAVRQSSKSVFENVLKIHSHVTTKVSDSDQLDSFVESILTHLFAMSWTSRGKFSALTSSVSLVGAQVMIERRPELPLEILMQLQEQALSCYASELYTALFTSHRQQLSSDLKQKDTWINVFLNTWVEPVVRALCSSDRKLKQNIIEYLLSKLMKADDQLLNHMIQRLSVISSDQVEPFHGAVIMCLRRAQVLGLLRPTPAGGDTSLWYGHLRSDVLKAALSNSDEQIRLDAFALLCDNYKTTEAITCFEFSMLKFFIPFNLNNQSPSFRQCFLSLLKKLFFRLKESMGALRRQSKKDRISNIQNTLQQYENFLLWLTNHFLESLYPGSAFARRTTSLAIISLMSTYFVTEQDGFALPRKLTNHHMQALLECFADTFEENKKEALKICTVYLAHRGQIWDKKGLEDIVKVSLTLACSTRPQDCSTAAYNFSLILRQLKYHPPEYDIADVLKCQLPPPVQLLVLRESSSAALLLLNILLSLLDDQISVASQNLITAAANRPMYPTLHCIRYIMQEFDFKNLPLDVVQAARDFIQRLIISCLNLSRVVSPVVQNSSPEGNIPEAVLGPGLNISNILEPGHAVSDNEVKNQQAVQEAEIDTHSRVLVESMPEYLVVCCWRSIKEVSLALGNMCLQIPVSQMSEESSDITLLSLEQVKIIGEYFTTQLLESIHRGAFELAYAGFQLMCQMLWNHPLASFHRLPAQWLTDVINNIKYDDPDSRLCSTRRSAGVPFFIQAVTSTEPAATGRKCFHSVMKDLLVLAISCPEPNKMGDTHKSSHAQVHALNVLRALFRDARLGEEVVQYIADGLKASILGFKSEQWAVQNSATLLLSALMTRMFGVKRSKDESNMSKKNCQTGRAFFHHYPSLYPFLLSELEEATTDVGSKDRIHLRPSLYPVLLVLGHLFPSILEGSDTSLSLSAFIPYVIRCAASPVYKTRVIASRALQPLASRNQVISISRQLCDNLPETVASQNKLSSHIHGSLLQLYQMAGLMGGLATSLQGDILCTILTRLNKRTWLISSNNTCFATRQAALLLVDIVLDIAVDICKKFPEHVKATDELRRTFLAALMEDTETLEQLWQPLYYEYEKTRARLCMKHLESFDNVATSFIHAQEVNGQLRMCLRNNDDGFKTHDHSPDVIETKCLAPKRLSHDIIVKLLDSPLYEVRIEILDVLSAVWSTDNVTKGTDCDPSECDSVEFTSEDVDAFSSGADSQRIEVKAGVSKTNAVGLASALFDHILKMAMDMETHHECLQKVFCILVNIPNCCRLLSEKSTTYIFETFSNLLRKIKQERRAEVMAAMLRFSGHLVALMYSSISSTTCECDQSLTVLTEWIHVVKSSSNSDTDPELQISCCHVLLENARILLCDPDNKLGNATFLNWDSLANLLQEDDLEVKDIAASVLCIIHGLTPGAYHPSYALHRLPTVLTSIHADRSLTTVVLCLLQWILSNDNFDIKDSSVRVFDKGEMNVYRDQVAFTRSIAETLAELFGLDIQGHFSNLVNTAEVNTEILADPDHSHSGIISDDNMIVCANDDSVITFLIDTIKSLTHDLELLLHSCQVTDIYMNNSRYLTLCQTVYKTKVVLSLFEREQFCLSSHSLRQCFDQVQSLLLKVSREFGFGNSITK